ncbi:MAG: hypothetical protein HY042_04460 [Spirochaetia bacterium]|nr:hypothetical protein [Spirochaetia bacterium]
MRRNSLLPKFLHACIPAAGAAIAFSFLTAAPAPLTDISDHISDAVIDVRYSTKNNFTGSVFDGYQANRAWARTDVAHALRRVADKLRPQGYRLKIYDVYRPLRAEAHMLRWARQTGKSHLIGVYIPSAVLPEATMGHTCGNMVDLTLVKLDGSDVDMGTDYDFFGEQAWTMKASGAALANRLLLKRAMEGEGFSNYQMEWWHFNYAKSPGKALDIVIR